MKFKYKWLNVAFSFVFALSLLGMPGQQPVAAKSAHAFADQEFMLQTSCLDGDRGRMSAADAFTGETQFIGTRAGEPIRVNPSLKGGSPEDVARSFLTQCGSLFGIQDESNELSLKKERLTEDGQRTMVRFQQQYQGIPVIAGELFVQLNDQKDILAAGGEILPRLYVDTTPAIDAAIARENALASVAKQYQLDVSELTSTEPALKIYDAALLEPRDGPTLLVWEMEITKTDAANLRQYVLVSAQRGNVVVSFSRVHLALDLATYDNNGTGTLPPAAARLECTEADLECNDDPADLDAKGAHRGAANTYNFYFNQHGRDSIDGAGMQIVSVIDYDDDDNTCPNAFWNGEQLVYCDSYAIADDVVGHEITHGVTEYESGLFYYYQSGAINESLSDVWGEFIDQSYSTFLDTDGVAVDWVLGEDVSGGAIRNMQDPTLFSDPDMMSSANYNENGCGDAFSDCDSGGVHSNSGVNNKAAYLMVVGGTFNSIPVTAIGMQKTAAVYYEVQTNLLTSGSDYRDLHDALYQACNNLVGITPPNAGSAISQADCDDGVLAAAEAVEMDEEPAVNYNPEAPVCDSGSQVNLFSDDLETANYNFDFAGINNTSNPTDYQRWFRFEDFYATSGITSIYGDDFDYDGGNNATSDTFVAMRARTYLPNTMANAYLRFNHAYGFEDSGGQNWDGGRVEYSLDSGTTWLDAGTMIDSASYGYNGVVSNLGTNGPNTSKNPLKNKSAFVADSHGFISTRLDLASLIGQNVLFRWRMATDQFGYDWGWWVDDIQIYSCLPVAPTVLSATFKSQAVNDGWILESTEASNKGNTLDAVAKLQVGDNLTDRQYKSIISFDTSSLPDTAVIVSATLKVRRSGGFIGQNPFNTHGPLVTDVRMPNFGTSAALLVTDFQAPVHLTAVSPFNPTPAAQAWYSANVSAASPYIYLMGTTQFRLRFTKDDNDDLGNDYVRFYAGETPGSAPQLIIEYYIP